MREIKSIADLERYTSCPFCETPYAYTEKDVFYIFSNGKTWSQYIRAMGKPYVKCPKCDIAFEI